MATAAATVVDAVARGLKVEVDSTAGMAGMVGPMAPGAQVELAETAEQEAAADWEASEALEGVVAAVEAARPAVHRHGTHWPDCSFRSRCPR